MSLGATEVAQDGGRCLNTSQKPMWLMSLQWVKTSMPASAIASPPHPVQVNDSPRASASARRARINPRHRRPQKLPPPRRSVEVTRTVQATRRAHGSKGACGGLEIDDERHGDQESRQASLGRCAPSPCGWPPKTRPRSTTCLPSKCCRGDLAAQDHGFVEILERGCHSPRATIGPTATLRGGANTPASRPTGSVSNLARSAVETEVPLVQLGHGVVCREVVLHRHHADVPWRKAHSSVSSPESTSVKLPVIQ